MKLHFIRALFLTLILGNNVMADKMIVDDMKNQSGIPEEEFCESGNAKWCFVTDKVMGGVSEGSLLQLGLATMHARVQESGADLPIEND